MTFWEHHIAANTGLRSIIDTSNESQYDIRLTDEVSFEV